MLKIVSMVSVDWTFGLCLVLVGKWEVLWQFKGTCRGKKSNELDIKDNGEKMEYSGSFLTKLFSLLLS